MRSCRAYSSAIFDSFVSTPRQTAILTPPCEDKRLNLKDLSEFVSQFLLRSVTTARTRAARPFSDAGAVKIRGSIRA
jgi:hypothetical protein